MQNDCLRFRETIESYKSAIAESGCVIVGYSGGADSSCLLRLMADFCKDFGVHFAAAHVNHCIRGEEADADENFCKITCESLGIEFYSLRVNVPEIAEKEKIGIEEAARRVRYEFFDDISEKITGNRKQAIIATAHNADDNLETVIFNLLRGTGIRGLCGIDPFRENRYLRPLINAESSAIREWCENNGVEYVIDRTNADIDYTRNRIRHIIVPEMKKVVSNPTRAVARMTEILRADRDYLEREAEKIAAVRPVSRKSLSELHDAVSSRVLCILFDSAKATDASLEEKHISEALRIMRSDLPRASISVPGAMRFTVDRDEVFFEPEPQRISYAEGAESESDCEKVLFSYPLDGDFYRGNGYSIEFSQSHHDFYVKNKKIEENIYKLSILRILRFDKISGVLRVRSRRKGDVFRYGGMTHKVKRLLSDKKLTAAEKERLPILEDDCGIVWIPGFPLRDGVAYDGEGTPLSVIYNTDHIDLRFIGGSK